MVSLSSTLWLMYCRISSQSSANAQPTAFTRPQTESFLAHVHGILQSERNRSERVRTSHIVFVFRWYANLINKLEPENNNDGAAAACFDVLLGLLTNFKLNDPQGMHEVKLALSQAFSQLYPYMTNNRTLFHEGCSHISSSDISFLSSVR